MRTLLILALLCPLLSAGQQPNKIMPLTIGDTLPDMALSNIVNYKTPSAKLSSFKGELLILDFWATWCTSCLKHFPQMDSLRQQYNGEVQVLLVNAKNTRDSEQKIKAFFEKRKAPGGKRYALPTVIYDTILTRLFPHKLIPHYVWLDSSRRVVAITGAGQLTAQNINAFLHHTAPRLAVKKDRVEYNKQKPLLQEENGGEKDKLLSASTLTKYLPGMPAAAFGVTEQDGVKKFTFLNKSIPALYVAALNFQPNRLVLEVKDTAPYAQVNEESEQGRQHLFCYELSLPAQTTPQQRAAFMVKDLNRLFNLSARFQKRLVDCWVLVQTSPPKKRLQTKGGAPYQHWPSTEEPFTRLHNVPLSALVNILNVQTPGWPVKPIIINETGITTNIDITLKTPLDDLPALKKELQPYGLDLIPAQREIEVFVLTENNGNEQPASIPAPAEAQTKTSSNQPKNKTQY